MANTEKFTGKAEIYNKNRPSYPDKLYDYLYDNLGFGFDSKIADIGSGTGIFSRGLLKRGGSVFCVEPNGDMRSIAESEYGDVKGFRSVNAPAEQTGLESISIDFITVAQAFHWFDREMFKKECQRILKSNGMVVLIWNRRSSSLLENRLNELNNEFCPDFKGFGGGRDTDPRAYADFFKDGRCEYKKFANDMAMNRDSFIGGCLSSSYALKQDDTNYEKYMSSLNGIFDSFNKNDWLVMPFVTDCYYGNV